MRWAGRAGPAGLVALMLLTLGNGAQAEPLESALRPEARPTASPPLRPMARPPDRVTPVAGQANDVTPPTAEAIAEAGGPAEPATEGTTEATAPEPATSAPEPEPVTAQASPPPQPEPEPPADEAPPPESQQHESGQPVPEQIVSRAAPTLHLPQMDAPPMVVRAAQPLAVVIDGPDDAAPDRIAAGQVSITDPPSPPVFTDAWDGATPPLRPGSVAAPPEGPEGVEAVASQTPLLRPAVRPDAIPAVAPAPVAQLRPRLRPEAPIDPVPPVPDTPDTPPAYAPGAQPGVAPDAPGYSIFAVARAIRPAERPRTVSVRAEQQQAERARGAICGSPDIQGDVVAPVAGSGGCGIAEPVRVRSVSGVQLSTPALMDCPTAQALNNWVTQGAIPAIGSHGGGLRTLQVMGHYTCRPMNNQAGQRLSEHGRGRAIDIGGFGLRNGTQISVLRGWNREGEGRILRQMHRAACGTFGTVLGPDSNRFHADHFHFDTARHRNGSFCR